MEVVFSIEVPALIKKEHKYFISYCPPLDIYSQGRTENSAKNNLIEAIQLFLISCFERGTLDEVLTDCGFKPLTVPSHKMHPRVSKGFSSLSIPLPFMINEDRLVDASLNPR